MGQTFEDLLNEFHEIRMHKFSNEPEREAAMLLAMEHTIQAMLEKLHDKLDPA